MLCAATLLAACGACNDLVGLGLTQVGVTDGNNGAAKRVVFESDRAELVESIYPFGDFDVYDLGERRAGDCLRFEMDASKMRAGLALVNGDTATVLDGLDGNAPDRLSIDHVFRAGVGRLLLYVGPGHVRMPPLEILPVPLSGDYRVIVSVVGRDLAPPAPRAQTVVLDFDGGRDERYFDREIILQPFRPGDYHPKLAAFSDLVRSSIMETVRAAYRQYNVRVVTSDDAPPTEPASRVYLTAPGYFQVGGTSYAGGQVRYIDFGNRDKQDVAIVSPSSFADDDSRGGNPAAFGRVVGELTAHEIGHLLGLTHQQEGLMSYKRSIDLVDGLLSGYFGFTDPNSAALFPDTPDLHQATTTYLAEVVGRNPAPERRTPSAPRRSRQRGSRR